MATYSDHEQRLLDQQFSAEMDRRAERAEMDRRDRREEREYDAMVRWHKPEPCRCSGDMPGHCPGPAFCPMCEVESEAGDVATCSRCGQSLADLTYGEVPDGCRDPACPGVAEAA